MPRLRLRQLWLLPLALLLVGCPAWQRHSARFPDDESVLHGAWTLEVTGFQRPAMHGLSLDGRRLLLWPDDVHPLYEREGHDAFLPWPRDPALTIGAYARHFGFDRSLETLFTLEYDWSTRRYLLQQQSLDGLLDRSTEVRPQADLDPWSASWFVQDGRLFLPRADGPAGSHLDVHDVDSGERTAQLALPKADRVLLDHHRRSVSFLDAAGGRVHLVDIGDPTSYRSLPAEGCSGGVRAELSQSGRWYVLSGCGMSARLFDLQAEPAVATLLEGVNELSYPVFASGSDELLWYLSDLAIARLEPGSGERDDFDLQAMGAPAPANPSAFAGVPAVWYADLELLVYPTALDRLVLVDLQADGTPSVQVLPELPVSRGDLDLLAHDLSQDGMSYAVSGELHAGGQTYTIDGRVEQNAYHYYPSATGLQPNAAPPNTRMVLSLQAFLEGELAFEVTAEGMYYSSYRLPDVYLGRPGGARALVELQRVEGP